MTDIATGSTTELWVELVRDAQARMHLTLGQSQESYLVFTLTRLCRDIRLTSHTAALEGLEACLASGVERIERLRETGDRCLLIAGLLPGQARRRGVRGDYYVAWGRLAYGELAVSARTALASLYAELAQTFSLLVDVLRGVRKRPEQAHDILNQSDEGSRSSVFEAEKILGRAADRSDRIVLH